MTAEKITLDVKVIALGLNQGINVGLITIGIGIAALQSVGTV